MFVREESERGWKLREECCFPLFGRIEKTIAREGSEVLLTTWCHLVSFAKYGQKIERKIGYGVKDGKKVPFALIFIYNFLILAFIFNF